MFEKSVEELTELGAQITTAEIAQQPELWRDTLNIYRENKEAIEAFLAEARAMGEPAVAEVAVEIRTETPEVHDLKVKVYLRKEERKFLFYS